MEFITIGLLIYFLLMLLLSNRSNLQSSNDHSFQDSPSESMGEEVIEQVLEEKLDKNFMTRKAYFALKRKEEKVKDRERIVMFSEMGVEAGLQRIDVEQKRTEVLKKEVEVTGKEVEQLVVAKENQVRNLIQDLAFKQRDFQQNVRDEKMNIKSLNIDYAQKVISTEYQLNNRALQLQSHNNDLTDRERDLFFNGQVQNFKNEVAKKELDFTVREKRFELGAKALNQELRETKINQDYNDKRQALQATKMELVNIGKKQQLDKISIGLDKRATAQFFQDQTMKLQHTANKQELENVNIALTKKGNEQHLKDEYMKLQQITDKQELKEIGINHQQTENLLELKGKALHLLRDKTHHSFDLKNFDLLQEKAGIKDAEKELYFQGLENAQNSRERTLMHNQKENELVVRHWKTELFKSSVDLQKQDYEYSKKFDLINRKWMIVNHLENEAIELRRENESLKAEMNRLSTENENFLSLPK